MNERFDVRFDEDAEKEYGRLDHSVLEIVNKAIDELVYRADEVGKNLGNHANTKLAGCKEIKLRDAGIRIIFRITNEVVEVLRVVSILTIERRSQDLAFQLANRRFKVLKGVPKAKVKAYLEQQLKWKRKNP